MQHLFLRRGGFADQDELIIGKIRFKTFDLGGHEPGRHISLLSCPLPFLSWLHFSFRGNRRLTAAFRLVLFPGIARKLWREYFATGVDGVVFIVDAVDRGRFPEAKKELDVSISFLPPQSHTSTLPATMPLADALCCWFSSPGQALLSEEELANVPFLVLGNKIDLGTAPSEEDLRYQLGLYETYGKETKVDKASNIRPIELYMCSVVRKMGYGDGFKWLAQFL